MGISHKIVQKTKGFLLEIGELSYFAKHFFKEVFTKPFEFKELLLQSYKMGNQSLLLVGVTGFILGLVFTSSVDTVGYTKCKSGCDNLSNLISPFFIVLLLWYPCFENLFSILKPLNVLQF